jgi:1-acyl-sn-glycerol-3-phosphate acyltransferase
MNSSDAPSRTGITVRILSVWTWFLIALIAIVWTPWMGLVYLATARRDPGRYKVGRWFRRAAVTAVKVNPLWRFTTSGVKLADPRRPYVAVANHESFADIFLLSHLPWEMKWLSKEEIFRIPLMGWMMRMAGDIPVSRGRRESRAAALQACRDRLGKDVSVIILPEGTRSPDGELQPFHQGAFRLAVQLQLPILPIALAGTRSAMPKGSLLFTRARARAHVLEPIETRGLTSDDVPELTRRVRALIAEARVGLLAELQEEGTPRRAA